MRPSVRCLCTHARSCTASPNVRGSPRRALAWPEDIVGPRASPGSGGSLGVRGEGGGLLGASHRHCPYALHGAAGELGQDVARAGLDEGVDLRVGEAPDGRLPADRRDDVTSQRLSQLVGSLVGVPVTFGTTGNTGR